MIKMLRRWQPEGGTWKRMFPFRVSAGTTLRWLPARPPAPFGGFFLYAARECGRVAVPFPAGQADHPGAMYPHPSLPTQPEQSGPSGLQARRKLCWSFLRTYRVHHATHKGTSPLRAGNPLLFLKGVSHGPFPSSVQRCTFAGRRPCAPATCVVPEYHGVSMISRFVLNAGLCHRPPTLRRQVVAATDVPSSSSSSPRVRGARSQPGDHGSCQGAKVHVQPTMPVVASTRGARTRRRSSPRRLRTARRHTIPGHILWLSAGQAAHSHAAVHGLGQLIEQLEGCRPQSLSAHHLHAGGCRCPRLHLGRSHATPKVVGPRRRSSHGLDRRVRGR